MNINKIKLEIIDLVLRTENETQLNNFLRILNMGHAPLESPGSENEESSDILNDPDYPYMSKATTLGEKKKILREALEEGEKSEMIENFNLEDFLQELHYEPKRSG